MSAVIWGTTIGFVAIVIAAVSAMYFDHEYRMKQLDQKPKARYKPVIRE